MILYFRRAKLVTSRKTCPLNILFGGTYVRGIFCVNIYVSRLLQSIIRPHEINFLFPFPARITFGESIKKNFIFYFIEFDVFSTTINFFSVKADPFCPLC